ncbi:hypothetical protein LIA77_01099 [Sarocladium implicatum]|nr:hypothetical protein LIA77_01099 [Sarocladium implicatum]
MERPGDLGDRHGMQIAKPSNEVEVRYLAVHCGCLERVKNRDRGNDACGIARRLRPHDCGCCNQSRLYQILAESGKFLKASRCAGWGRLIYNLVASGTTTRMYRRSSALAICYRDEMESETHLCRCLPVQI